MVKGLQDKTSQEWIVAAHLILELVSSSSSVDVNCLLSSSELLPADPLLEESLLMLALFPSALELSPLE